MSADQKKMTFEEFDMTPKEVGEIMIKAMIDKLFELKKEEFLKQADSMLKNIRTSDENREEVNRKLDHIIKIIG